LAQAAAGSTKAAASICAAPAALSVAPVGRPGGELRNQIWCAIVALAVELTAWMQTLALAGHDARRWEPKRLRLRLFSIAGRLAEHGRTRRLHLSAHAPWAGLLAEMINRLQTLPAPGGSPPTAPTTLHVHPAPHGRPRANRHTLTAQSPVTLDNNVETTKVGDLMKDPG
jgi:hypothetical protein